MPIALRLELEGTPIPSEDFDIDYTTGAVYAVIENPLPGNHSLMIEAYNTSSDDPEQTKGTGTVST